MVSESCIATHLHLLAMTKTTLSLTTLPNELYEPILSNLFKYDLKRLHATCKLFYTLTSPHIFRDIILLPFRRHLARFSELTKNSRLAGEVREIRYDHYWDGGIQELLDRTFPNPEQALVLSTAQQNRFITPSGYDDELQLLTSIITHLPGLRHVAVREYFHPQEILDLGDVPESFHQLISLLDPYFYMLSKAYDNRLPFASDSALIAASAAHSTVSSFSADGLDLVHFTQEWSSTHSSHKADLLCGPLDLSRFKRLELSDVVKYEATQPYAESFVKIITTAVNLENLKLDFGYSWTCTSDEPDWYPEAMRGMQIIRALHHVGRQFPTLKSFTLSGVSCKEQDLLGFLFEHVGTLCSLELSFLTLDRSSRNDRLPCVVNFLAQLRGLGLEHFSLEEVFRNTGNQALRVGGPIWDRDDLKPVRSAITSWVTNQVDETPEMLRRLAIQPGEDDLRLPDKEDPGWKHDEIWGLVELPRDYDWDGGEENAEANWIDDNGAEQDVDLAGDGNFEEEERSDVESESADDEWEL